MVSRSLCCFITTKTWRPSRAIRLPSRTGKRAWMCPCASHILKCRTRECTSAKWRRAVAKQRVRTGADFMSQVSPASSSLLSCRWPKQRSLSGTEGTFPLLLLSVRSADFHFQPDSHPTCCVAARFFIIPKTLNACAHLIPCVYSPCVSLQPGTTSPRFTQAMAMIRSASPAAATRKDRFAGLMGTVRR